MKWYLNFTGCVIFPVFICGAAVMGIELDEAVKGAADVLSPIESEQQSKEEKNAAPSETQSAGENLNQEQSDTNAMGIREALTRGIEKAVAQVSAENGFYKNEAIKILLPENLRKADTIVRQLGGARLSDALVLKMNRAAEKAAPQALDIFVSAVSNMQIDDAMQILSGGETAATDYLKVNTSGSLNEAFYPIVKETMEELGTVRLYNDYKAKAASNPLMKMMDMDISRYVTKESIDGLFNVVAQEEKNIRRNPVARTSDLLKKVFGRPGN